MHERKLNFLMKFFKSVTSFSVYIWNEQDIHKTTFFIIYHCHQCFTTAKICLVHIHVFIEQNLVLKNNKWLLKKTCTFSTNFKGMFHFSMALYTKSLKKQEAIRFINSWKTISQWFSLIIYKVLKCNIYQAHLAKTKNT